MNDREESDPPNLLLFEPREERPEVGVGVEASGGSGAELHELAEWRARRAAKEDAPIGAPPFVLEEPCPGCGAQRVSTMVWRRAAPGSRPIPFPRIAPHFACRDGRVLWQDITDSPLSPADWRRILGHFEEAEGRSG